MNLNLDLLEEYNTTLSNYINQKCFSSKARPTDPIMNALYEYPVWLPRSPHDFHLHTGYISVQMKGMLVLLHKLLYI